MLRASEDREAKETEWREALQFAVNEGSERVFNVEWLIDNSRSDQGHLTWS